MSRIVNKLRKENAELLVENKKLREMLKRSNELLDEVTSTLAEMSDEGDD